MVAPLPYNSDITNRLIHAGMQSSCCCSEEIHSPSSAAIPALFCAADNGCDVNAAIPALFSCPLHVQLRNTNRQRGLLHSEGAVNSHAWGVRRPLYTDMQPAGDRQPIFTPWMTVHTFSQYWLYTNGSCCRESVKRTTSPVNVRSTSWVGSSAAQR